MEVDNANIHNLPVQVTASKQEQRYIKIKSSTMSSSEVQYIGFFRLTRVTTFFRNSGTAVHQVPRPKSQITSS